MSEERLKEQLRQTENNLSDEVILNTRKKLPVWYTTRPH